MARSPHVLPPAVAGAFYPGEPGELRALVDGLLDEAPAPAGRSPKGLIVPHAGYIYSGPIAASGYAMLRGAAARIRRVVLVGPSHRFAFEGLALPEASAVETPLGTIQIDAAAREALAGRVLETDEPHAHEHSLEVQLPFLQRVLPAFTLVPLAAGRAGAEEVADVLDAVWGGDETVVVISSDLSHYLRYDEARAVDERTASRIVSGERVGWDDACGSVGVNGFLLACRRHGLAATRLDLRNSGDTAGPRDRVVGYGSFGFGEAHAAG